MKDRVALLARVDGPCWLPFFPPSSSSCNLSTKPKLYSFSRGPVVACFGDAWNPGEGWSGPQGGHRQSIVMHITRLKVRQRWQKRTRAFFCDILGTSMCCWSLICFLDPLLLTCLLLPLLLPLPHLSFFLRVPAHPERGTANSAHTRTQASSGDACVRRVPLVYVRPDGAWSARGEHEYDRGPERATWDCERSIHGTLPHHAREHNVSPFCVAVRIISVLGGTTQSGSCSTFLVAHRSCSSSVNLFEAFGYISSSFPEYVFTFPLSHLLRSC